MFTAAVYCNLCCTSHCKAFTVLSRPCSLFMAVKMSNTAVVVLFGRVWLVMLIFQFRDIFLQVISTADKLLLSVTVLGMRVRSPTHFVLIWVVQVFGSQLSHKTKTELGFTKVRIISRKSFFVFSVPIWHWLTLDNFSVL